MAIINSKVCIVGDFAVGKTSTVERFVCQQFSDKYHTTIGIKVDTKDIKVGDIDHKLVIWDIAGTDQFSDREFSYLRGSAGYILVADGTRNETILAAVKLRDQIHNKYGNIPHVFLINKSDLREDWELENEHLASLEQNFPKVFISSAKTGNEVDSAFSSLASLILETSSTSS